MNESATVPRHMNDINDMNAINDDTHGVNLGTSFTIELDSLKEFTIEQFIAALQATTTLKSLRVDFPYDQTPEIIQNRMIPLCHCISRLRLENENHPLRKLILRGRGRYAGDASLVQFLHSAKQCGIFHMKFYELNNLPFPLLVDFCRNNNSLKVLEICYMSLSGGSAGMSWSPNDNGQQDSSIFPTLDELIVYRLYMLDSAAATEFKFFVERVNFLALGLGNVTAPLGENHLERNKRLLSRLLKPTIERLALMNDYPCHHMDAIAVGMTSVVELDVSIDFDDFYHYGRLQEIAHFVSVSCNLNHFTIRADPLQQRHRHYRMPNPTILFQNIQACATVTHIQVNNNDRDDFDADEIRLLQKVTSRNQELARFIANPSTYPSNKLLSLIPDLDNCPTGRYMLARRLPGVLSFATIQSTKPKKRKRRARKASRRANF